MVYHCANEERHYITLGDTTMPTAIKRNQGKTSFVKEFLVDNPLANTKSVNNAWTAQGMDGTISGTLVNKMRSQLGLAGNLRGKRRSKNETATAEKRPYTGKKRGRKPKNASIQADAAVVDSTRTKSAPRKSHLIELEAELDRLLFKTMSLGGLTEIEDSLREIRRKLYTKFSGN
jgi:hypothetical protein